MEPDDFKSLLARFAQRPVPPLADRHVYLWHGELPALQALSPPGLSVYLDLHELTGSLQRMPYAADEARRVLQAAIQAWLDQQAPSAGGQRLIVVTGAGLLARYRVPLNAFFTRAGDTQMVVFVLPPHETDFRPSIPLPLYVVFTPHAALDYLRSKLGDNAIVGAGTQ